MYTITNDANEPLYNAATFGDAMAWFYDRAIITTSYQRRMVTERLCATGGHTHITPGDPCPDEVFAPVANGYILHYAPN